MGKLKAKTIPSDELRRLADCDHQAWCQLERLIGCYGMQLSLVRSQQDIAGSYWGGCEAGLIGRQLYARADTPLHSILHELGHYICMPASRRARLDTNAGGDYTEENAVCYLQILLAGQLHYDQAAITQDMDRWGYSFRLGSAGAWFLHDAEDARLSLLTWQIIDHNERVHLGRLRQ